jgi:hypothetical protein
MKKSLTHFMIITSGFQASYWRNGELTRESKRSSYIFYNLHYFLIYWFYCLIQLKKSYREKKS